MGLSVCFDLRFPELFRKLGTPDIITLPAAFTTFTGRAHWDALLRARAIENQCYVLACAQGGVHESGRQTWGHSILIDPWGATVAELTQGEGVLLGEVYENRIKQAREKPHALIDGAIATGVTVCAPIALLFIVMTNSFLQWPDPDTDL